ncbi:PrsW family intramembrane metalloprotease [Myxococcota bacterium]
MLSAMFLAGLFVLPVVLVYVLMIKGMDRLEPEPWWLLGVMFLWGALGSTLSAMIFNEVGQTAVSYALDASARDPQVNMLTAVLVAPPVEESTKGFGLLLLWGASAVALKELDGPLDGAIYGGVVGLGFTLTEDVLYIASAQAQGGMAGFASVFLLRTVLAGLGHATFTAMTGLAIGMASETRNLAAKITLPVAGWGAAVGLHALHNYLATFFLQYGGLLFKLLLFWVFSGLFFVLLFVLALRDRAIVVQGLVDEVGRALHPVEYRRTISYWMFVPLANFFVLLSGTGGYRAARRKQLDLIELAFLKHRQRYGDGAMDSRERQLRGLIAHANQRGVFVGPRT